MEGLIALVAIVAITAFFAGALFGAVLATEPPQEDKTPPHYWKERF